MTSTIAFDPRLSISDSSAQFWLQQVTVRLRREITWQREQRGVTGGHDNTLPPFVDPVQESLDMLRFHDAKHRFFAEDTTAGYLSGLLNSSIEDTVESPVYGSFSWISRQLALSPVANFTLALGLAHAIDPALAPVIAACLNMPGKTAPNLALVQQLWDMPDEVLELSDPSHKLFTHSLLMFEAGGQAQVSHLNWHAPFSMHPMVAQSLLHPGQKAYSAACNHAVNALRVIPISGDEGANHFETARQIASSEGRPLMRLGASEQVAPSTHYMKACATIAWLQHTDLFFDAEFVASVTKEKQHQLFQLLPSRQLPITIYLGITDKRQFASIPASLRSPVQQVPAMSHDKRVAYWKEKLDAQPALKKQDIADVARRFRYPQATIDRIVARLKQSKAAVARQLLLQACQEYLEIDVGELAQRVQPRFTKEHLILPKKQEKQFQELLQGMHNLTEVHYGWGTAEAWNESGITALFAGPPGTGKTMGAELLARKLDMPMYRIDLSQVVNKYIGETEKNLKKLFDTADQADIILFFDEADSIFGKRTEVKDAHDRYANLEISYLLERMERFKGLAILATNRKKDLDEAFMRRIRYIIDFPLPDVEQRKQIWEQAIPQNADASDINTEFLAQQFSLSGGHIRSIVLNACLLCAKADGSTNGVGRRLTMEAMITAVKREYDKLNRNLSLAHFGPYANIIEEMDRSDA